MLMSVEDNDKTVRRGRTSRPLYNPFTPLNQPPRLRLSWNGPPDTPITRELVDSGVKGGEPCRPHREKCAQVSKFLALARPAAGFLDGKSDVWLPGRDARIPMAERGSRLDLDGLLAMERCSKAGRWWRQWVAADER